MSLLLRRHTTLSVEEYSVLQEEDVVGLITRAGDEWQPAWSWAITIGEVHIPGDRGYAESLLSAHGGLEKAWPIIAEILKAGT